VLIEAPLLGRGGEREKKNERWEGLGDDVPGLQPAQNLNTTHIAETES